MVLVILTTNISERENKLDKLKQLLGIIRSTLLNISDKKIIKVLQNNENPESALWIRNSAWTAQLMKIMIAKIKLLRPLAAYTLYDH
jgi:hypothetical protein